LRNLQSNIETNSIWRAAKSIGLVNSICEIFEKATKKVKGNSDNHNVPSMKKEINVIVDSLLEYPSVLSNQKCHNINTVYDFVCDYIKQKVVTK
jgi:phage pi2 protein 07